MERSEGKASAVLTARRDAGAGLYLVTLAVDDALAGAYVAPGQYVEVKTRHGAAGFFVLTGGPGGTSWELLVRNAGAAADELVTAALGEPVIVSAPLGLGLPVAEVAGRPLVLAVATSALGAARAVVRQRIAARETQATSLFVGLRVPGELPLADELEAWASAGLRVVLCVSGAGALGTLPEAARAPRIEHRAGYVQHVVAEELVARRIAPSATIFAVGSDAMVAELRAVGAAAGIAVRSNV